MGQDKASIKIGDLTMAERVAKELAKVCSRVTVLGPSAVRGATDHIPDEEDYPGPLVALSRVQPQADALFIASCDLPAFDATIVEYCLQQIDGFDAAIPVLDERPQPLCALYRSSALSSARALTQAGERRIMVWVGSLQARFLDVTHTRLAAIVRNANTQEELRSALKQERH